MLQKIGITNRGNYYKMEQRIIKRLSQSEIEVYYKVRQVLQDMTDYYYKIR